MGGIAKAVGKVAAPVMTGGLSLLGKPLGLSMEDEQGAYVTPAEQRKKEYDAFLDDYKGQQAQAEDVIKGGAFTKDLFGQGGLQNQLAKEQQDLSSRGFSLQPQDYEAYGQTAGDVSRLFGQQNQAAASELARRGLGSASSGAAGAKFAGLQGNKNEMLARAQTDIAQKRMADTQRRLSETRDRMTQMTGFGKELQQQEYNQKGGSYEKRAALENQFNENQRQALADQQAAVKPGLFSTIGQGLQRGIGQMAQAAPGMAIGGIGGGAASGMGGGGAASSVAAPSAASGFGASSYGASGFANKKGPSLFG